MCLDFFHSIQSIYHSLFSHPPVEAGRDKIFTLFLKIRMWYKVGTFHQFFFCTKNHPGHGQGDRVERYSPASNSFRDTALNCQKRHNTQNVSVQYMDVHHQIITILLFGVKFDGKHLTNDKVKAVMYITTFPTHYMY